MCKKLLSGLMGGGKPVDVKQPAAEIVNAPADANKAVVKDVAVADGTGNTVLKVEEDKKKRLGVPGLGL